MVRVALAATLAGTALITSAALSGCGGSGAAARSASGTSATAQTGRATVSIRWPERTNTRLIPFASESIRVHVVRDGATLGEALLTRPANGGNATATFDRLPSGPVQVQAIAYPSATGSGVAQARAEVTVEVQAGQTTPTRLTLQSTIDRLEVTSGLSRLAVGQSTAFAATARNQAGEVVLTAPATLQWSSSAPGVVSLSGHVATGVASGQSVVTVRDSESGKTASLNVFVGEASGVQPITLALPVNDMVYSQATGRIYASVGSSVANGNSIATINPATGQVEKTTFIGSEPGPTAISDDGQYVYVGLRGAPTVCRYNIAQNKKDLEFGLGSDGFTGGYYAEQIAVMPGNPNTVAVSKRNQGFSPRHEGVTIYDSGVARPVSTPGHTGPNRIEWAGPTRIYGYNNETTGFGFYRLTVSSTGVVVQDEFDSFDGDLISGFNVELEYEAGRILTTSGRLVDAENRTLLGTFAGRGPVVPNLPRNRVFFAAGNNFGISEGPLRIEAYDAGTYLRVGELVIAGGVGEPRRLVRWGDNGLAVSTSENQIYFIGQAPGL